MPAPESPSEETIESPPESDVETTYYHLTGVRSRNSSAEWLVNDCSNAAIVVHSTADIFLQAAGTIQMLSNTHMHNVSGKNTQFFGLVDRQVETDQNVVIGADNQIHINGNQTVNVVSDHLLNIAQKQIVQVGTAQTVDIAGGNRTLDVQSGGVEITVGGGGAFTKNTQGNYFPTTIGKKDRFHNSTKTEQNHGDFFGTKTSTELSTTAALKRTVTASAEATATAGANAKITHASTYELNLGIKHEIVMGGERKFNNAKVDDWFLIEEVVTKASQQKKVNLLIMKALILSAKESKEKEKATMAIKD